MNLTHFGRLLLIVFFIATLEVGLEVRHHLLGWGTLLFAQAKAGEAARGSAANRNGKFPFRSPLVKTANKDQELRIWIASSSHAEDRQLPLSDIFPTLLQAELNGKGFPAVVANGSRAGMTVADNIESLSAYGSSWKPHFVVLYQTLNDINKLARMSDAGNGVSPDSDHQAGLMQSIRRQLQRTSLYVHLRSYIGGTILASAPLHGRLPDEAKAKFRKDLTDFISQVQAMGARPVLATFATRYDVGDSEDIPYSTRIEMLRWNPYLSVKGWLQSVGDLEAIIRTVAAENKIPVIDVRASMTGKSQLFRDFSHFSSKGHAEIADLLARRLLLLHQDKFALLTAPSGPSDDF